VLELYCCQQECADLINNDHAAISLLFLGYSFNQTITHADQSIQEDILVQMNILPCLAVFTLHCFSRASREIQCYSKRTFFPDKRWVKQTANGDSAAMIVEEHSDVARKRLKA
jgi:hypothetical protein